MGFTNNHVSRHSGGLGKNFFPNVGGGAESQKGQPLAVANAKRGGPWDHPSELAARNESYLFTWTLRDSALWHTRVSSVYSLRRSIALRWTTAR